MYAVENDAGRVFEFSYEGETYSVPARESLPYKTFVRIQELIDGADDKSAAAIAAVTGLFNEYAPGVIDKLTVEQALKLITAYSEAGDEPSLGES